MMPRFRPNGLVHISNIHAKLRNWRWLCVTLLAAGLLVTQDYQIVSARSTSHRRDRRPDREVRIRYPRSQSNSSQGSSSTLQAAPPATQPNSAPSGE